MRLVYKDTMREVALDDLITRGGEAYRVSYFRPPHKPASSGHVTLKHLGSGQEVEFYVGIINAEWIEREDQR